MKKILVPLMLCFINSIQADTLSDAIRASNVEKVSQFLSEHKLNDKQIIKYLDTAEQTIRTRRENIILSELGKYTTEIPREAQAFCGKMALIFLGSFLMGVGAGIESERTHNELMASFSLGFLTLSGISLCASIGAYFRAFCLVYKDPKVLYSDAITIKEMLYDYASGLTTDH